MSDSEDDFAVTKPLTACVSRTCAEGQVGSAISPGPAAFDSANAYHQNTSTATVSDSRAHRTSVHEPQASATNGKRKRIKEAERPAPKGGKQRRPPSRNRSRAAHLADKDCVNEYYINSVPVTFPFKPYPSQMAIMSKASFPIHHIDSGKDSVPSNHDTPGVAVDPVFPECHNRVSNWFGQESCVGVSVVILFADAKPV
jgi:hypothetical protein